MARKPKDEHDEPEPTAPDPKGDPDAAILRGGPGQDPAAPADEPEPARDEPRRAKVRIGKKEFDVDPDIAAAVEERERDYMRGIQMDREARAELDRYRRAASPTPPANAEPDYDTMIFERPKEALARFKQEITSELETRYRTEQTIRQWWDDFYDSHPDLKEEESFVRARLGVMLRDVDISALPQKKAHELLADDVRGEILRISRKARGSGDPQPKPSGRAVVEGASGDRPTRPSRGEDDDQPTSLSDEIRRRATRRREARTA